LRSRPYNTLTLPCESVILSAFKLRRIGGTVAEWLAYPLAMLNVVTSILGVTAAACRVNIYHYKFLFGCLLSVRMHIVFMW